MVNTKNTLFSFIVLICFKLICFLIIVLNTEKLKIKMENKDLKYELVASQVNIFKGKI